MLEFGVMLSRKLLFLILFIFASSILPNGFAGIAEELRVTRVIDGDTVVLEDGRHVRYIGMDTPEKKDPYYSEAKRENERLVKGKKVGLEYDVGKTDKYGRTLAYVYADTVFVNAELVKNGYAVIATFPPNVKYAKTFLALQEEARNQKRGLWGLSDQAGGQSGKKSFWDYISYKFKRIFR